MPALREPQYEKFCIECVELSFGGNRNPVLEAYKNAGFAAHRGNAARLRKRPEVTARIAELVAEAIEFANVRAKRVVVEIDRVGRSNIADYYEVVTDEKSGRPVTRLKNLTEMPREMTAAIASLEWDDNGNPKLKLHDKNQANFTLLKHMGGLPESTPIGGGTTVNILNAVSIEDQAALADLIEAIAGGVAALGEPVPAERRETAAVP